MNFISRIFEPLRYVIFQKFDQIRLRLLKKQRIVSGSCNLCGKCCKNLSLDYQGHWIRKKGEFAALVKANKQYERFQIIGKDSFGHLVFKCDQLQADNTCGDHKNRPDICRNYPEINMIYMDAKLLKGCGYQFQEVRDFDKVLKSKMD